MRAWLCAFFLCKWVHVMNVDRDFPEQVGIYQCCRCKTISIGCARY